MEPFLHWWQTLPFSMNPVIFSVGSFAVRWYGMMYIVAFAVVYLVVRYRLATEKLPFNKTFVGDALTWAMVGVVVGGRLGYILFYGFADFVANPLQSFFPWICSPDGSCRFSGISGMSYHGGVLGVIGAMWLFTRSQRQNFFQVFDLFIPAIPLGYTFGRLGNFINGELYGRVTEAAIGMYFPTAPTIALRHPSQLYEAFFEGIVLFVVLWMLRKRSPFAGFLSALYLFGYGFVRFFIEFFREPDAHLGFVFFSFSMGQVLCIAMMVAGIVLFAVAKKLSNNTIKA
jgi:phosphatidylglycerol:prolipoprotein diacylglycerol transferase